MIREKLTGVGVAMITPFTSDGRVDYQALARMIDYVIEGGVDYIVALGTTAETPTLYMPERAVIAMFITNHIAGRVPLVMGCGGNSTSEVLDQLREFDLRGADAILSVTPYYNKPSQEGLYQHFRTVSEHSPLPVILYNIPGRSGVNMTAETTLRCAADFRNVIGVRYRLVPYLYSEYMKAALNDDMYFKPLAFVYPDDKLARNTEDQLMIGNEIMIAPVYTQNAIGRYVYLPEEMMFVKFLGNGNMFQEILPKGIHYVEVALNEVPLFIRKGCAIPVADFAESVPDIKEESIRMVGYEGASYERYTDDGVSRI